MLPRGVRQKHGRYYLVRRQGARTHWIGLTRVSEGAAALHAAMEALEPAKTVRTVGDLMRAFLADDSLDLAPVTRREYQRIARARIIPIVGHMLIEDMKPSIVAGYLERARRDGRAVSANRSRATLSSAYEWGMRNGYAESNPCRGVRRNKERPARIYVSDEQYPVAGSPTG